MTRLLYVSATNTTLLVMRLFYVSNTNMTCGTIPSLVSATNTAHPWRSGSPNFLGFATNPLHSKFHRGAIQILDYQASTTNAISHFYCVTHVVS